jgi:hypothetical protein
VNIQTFSTITSSVVVLAFLLRAAEFRFKLGAIYVLIGLASLLALFIAVKLSNESIVEVLRFSPTANIVRFGSLGVSLGFVLAGAIVCLAAGMRRRRPQR